MRVSIVTLISALVLCNGFGCSSPEQAGTEVETDVFEADTHPTDTYPADTHPADADEDTAEDVLPDPAPVHWPEQNMRGAEPLGLSWTMPEAGPESMSVLVANVGNIDILRCGTVAFNMCWTEQEQIVTARIAALNPDVILLQEVMSADQCDALDAPPEDHVCHASFVPDAVDQARRLVGDDYTIACDGRRGWECIAVKVSAGSIEGCEPGALCPTGARVAPLVEGCDPGFTISAVTASIAGGTLDLINVHPPSNIAGPEAGQACRKGYLEHVFEDGAMLVENEVVFVAGDFNKDPWRELDALDVLYWNEHVSPHRDDAERTFAYHSGILEHDPPYYTSVLSRKTLDHAVSRGLIGHCITLGAHEGHGPLDLFHGRPIEQLDHLAIWCTLSFE